MDAQDQALDQVLAASAFPLIWIQSYQTISLDAGTPLPMKLGSCRIPGLYDGHRPTLRKFANLETRPRISHQGPAWNPLEGGKIKPMCTVDGLIWEAYIGSTAEVTRTAGAQKP